MRLLQPLRQGAFLRLFIGTVTTRIGDAMASLVLIWVTLQAHGPVALGSVLLVTAIPALVVAPAAGHLVARAGLARAVRLDNTARSAAVLGLALLMSTGEPSLPLLYVYAVIAGLTGPATEIAVDSATPEVVADQDLNEANTLISISWDLSDLIGPVTAGALMVWVGGPGVLLLVALCYGCMALIAPAIPLAASPTDSDQDPTTRQGLLTGFRLLFTTYRPSLYITLISLFVLAASGAVEVLLPLLVSRSIGAGPAELGILMSIFGAVSLAATAILGPRVSRHPPLTPWPPHLRSEALAPRSWVPLAESARQRPPVASPQAQTARSIPSCAPPNNASSQPTTAPWSPGPAARLTSQDSPSATSSAVSPEPT